MKGRPLISTGYWRFLGLVAVLALMLLTRSSHAADLTLEEIVEKTRAWRANFSTIQIKTRAWHRQDFIDANPGVDPDAALGKTDFREEDFDWADIGAVRYESRIITKGKLESRSMGVRDGRRGESLTSTVIVPLHGVWCSGEETWFSERIARSADATLVGYEELDNRRCARVRLRLNAGDPLKEEQHDYWLDEEDGFVPRQLTTKGPVATAAGKLPLGHWYTWHADDFEHVQEVCWFPVRGTFTELDRPPPGFEWFVDEVFLNSLSPDAIEAAEPEAGSATFSSTSATNGTELPIPSGAPQDAAPFDPLAERRIPWAWIAAIVGAVAMVVVGLRIALTRVW